MTISPKVLRLHGKHHTALHALMTMLAVSAHCFPHQTSMSKATFSDRTLNVERAGGIADNAGTAPHLYTPPQTGTALHPYTPPQTGTAPHPYTPPQNGTALEIDQFSSSAVRVSGSQDLLYLHISSESQMLTTGAISSSKNNFCRS